MTDGVSPDPESEHWSYGSFRFDLDIARRTVPLVPDDGTAAALTVPEFVSEPRDLAEISRIVIDGVRALGEPPGSRGLTDEENSADEPGQSAPPPHARQPQPPAHPRAEGEAGDEAADDRMLPFPYAESCDKWVTDEAAAPMSHRKGKTKENEDGRRLRPHSSHRRRLEKHR